MKGMAVKEELQDEHADEKRTEQALYSTTSENSRSNIPVLL